MRSQEVPVDFLFVAAWLCFATLIYISCAAQAIKTYFISNTHTDIQSITFCLNFDSLFAIERINYTRNSAECSIQRQVNEEPRIYN